MLALLPREYPLLLYDILTTNLPPLAVMLAYPLVFLRLGRRLRWAFSRTTWLVKQ
jgi:hypothetical protein